VERQNKPEVEYNVHPELMLPPVRALYRRSVQHALPLQTLPHAQCNPPSLTRSCCA
jgi:hypothetical protein